MRRIYTIQILATTIFLLFVLIKCQARSEAALRGVELLRVQPLGQQVQVSVLVISDDAPEVSSVGATRVQVFPTSDSAGAHRTTITATLDSCRGRLVVRDGDDRWQWRPSCQYLPYVTAAEAR